MMALVLHATYPANDFWKALQHALFPGARKPVQRPGSRGGRFYYAQDGTLRYGAPGARAPSGPPIGEQGALFKGRLVFGQRRAAC